MKTTLAWYDAEKCGLVSVAAAIGTLTPVDAQRMAAQLLNAAAAALADADTLVGEPILIARCVALWNGVTAHRCHLDAGHGGAHWTEGYEIGWTT